MEISKPKTNISKRNLSKLALAGALGVSALLGAGQFASAAEVAEYKTKANVNFVENGEVVDPIDPDNPDIPVGPVDPDPDNPDPIQPGTPGPLSIDYASHINFGEVMKSGNKETYYANPITIQSADGGESLKRAPFVQVTDNRGTNAGWSLQVKQDAQLTHESDSQLDGAVIALGTGVVNSVGNTDGVNPSEVAFENIGDMYDVFGAEEGTGAGTFTNKFGDLTDGKAKNVSLTVPQGSTIKDGLYTTDLTWVLSDTPDI